jgi:predicted phosphoribosyltransferase
VPVIAPEIYLRLSPKVENLISRLKPKRLNSISQWYEDFHQLSDEKAEDYLIASDNRSFSLKP